MSVLDKTGLTYFWGKITAKLGLKADASSVYTKTQVDDMIEDVAYFGDTVGNVVTADFNAQSDTVWNKTQVLSSAQQAQARTNIGAGTVNSVTVNGTTYTPNNGDVDLGTIGGGGGGASAINDLTDVTISSPSNGQALLYDSTTSKWVNGTVSGGGGSPSFTVYTAAWTATSSSGNTTRLSDILTLPAGLYIVRMQIPYTKSTLLLQLDGTNFTQRSNTYYSGTLYSVFVDFVEVNSGGGTLFIRCASGGSFTFSYLERGSLKALKLM